MKKKSEAERVWMLCAAALAALFLLRSAGMIFSGAITGFGMYVAIYVLISWYPVVKSILFGMGGAFDLAISFGLPYVITTMLGITGGTMLIATLTCGLMFTFTLTTTRLGGPVSAIGKSGAVLFEGAKESFDKWQENWNGRNQVGSNRSHEPRNARSRSECEESEEEARRQPRRLTLGKDYEVF